MAKSSKIKKSHSTALEEPSHKTSEAKVSGVIFSPEILQQTLTDLNRIFDTHHRKYKNRTEWRRAIIEELAGWKLGISAHKEP